MAATHREPEVQNLEVDTLGHLEDRIQKTVALVNRLRQEKDAALRELAASQQAFENSHAESTRLAGELEALQAERQQVRGRLEKLLGHIDQLGTA
jgi:FtsZ-binding cell division protein ZapB